MAKPKKRPGREFEELVARIETTLAPLIWAGVGLPDFP